MAAKIGTTNRNPQDDLPGTTKGGVVNTPTMPILMPPNPGTDPMLDHPVIPVATFQTGDDPGT